MKSKARRGFRSLPHQSKSKNMGRTEKVKKNNGTSWQEKSPNDDLQHIGNKWESTELKQESIESFGQIFLLKITLIPLRKGLNMSPEVSQWI